MLNILKAMQLYILGRWYMNCTSIKLLSKLYEVVIAVSEPAGEVSTIQVFLPLNTKLKMELGIGEDLKQSEQSKSAPMEQEGEN